jgi:HD superfamily phosphohydrolase
MNVNHNRFEHSVGVAHLAERMCRRLQTRQPNLEITDKDVLCIKLAGLCHDLGHGPFSHTYCDMFPKELQKHLNKNPHLLKHYENLPDVPEGWEHEDASLMMIDAALENLGLAIDMNNLDLPLRQIGDGVKAESMRVYKQSADENRKPDTADILTSRDWVFIKECIKGKPLGTHPMDPELSGFLGRPFRRQEFLYDIISNRHSGLDVDKMDYFARDARRANGGSGEIQIRMIDEAVVAWAKCPQPNTCFACTSHDPGMHLMICYPEKMDRSAMEFFRIRFRNHQQIYSHKTPIAATFMLCDIFTSADPFFRIPTYLDSDHRCFKSDEGPKGLPISRAMLHKTSFLRLRDSVIDQIMATTTPELKESRLLIERLWNRDLYKCAGSIPIDSTTSSGQALSAMTEEKIKIDILKFRGEHKGSDGRPIYLEDDDFIVEKNKIHHGKKTINPVMLMRFLPKRELRSLTSPVNKLPMAYQTKNLNYGNTPVVMQEESIRVFCRGDNEKLDLLRHVFELWEHAMDSEIQITADDSSNSDFDEQDEPVALTQESLMSPSARGDFESDNERSPFPVLGNVFTYRR